MGIIHRKAHQGGRIKPMKMDIKDDNNPDPMTLPASVLHKEKPKFPPMVYGAPAKTTMTSQPPLITYDSISPAQILENIGTFASKARGKRRKSSAGVKLEI